MQGGHGTGLTDYCVAPKGEYHFKTYRLTSSGGAWTETLLSGLNKVYDDTFDGKKNGLDCYKDNIGEGSYTGPRVFDQSSDGNMSNLDRNNYYISPASGGRGGAIVIMW